MESHILINHQSSALSINPRVFAFSNSVLDFALSIPAGTSASMSSFSSTDAPGRVVSCWTIASTIWCISRAGRSAQIMTVPRKRVGSFCFSSVMPTRGYRRRAEPCSRACPGRAARFICSTMPGRRYERWRREIAVLPAIVVARLAGSAATSIFVCAFRL